MRTTILLFFILSFSFLVYSQQLQTVKVSLYSKVLLPQEPIVYFPATSLSLGKGGITVKRNNANGEVVTEPEVIIDTTMVYKPKKSDLGSSEGRGYPFSCAAELTFTKPGQTYYVKISASSSCLGCNDPTTVPMGLYIGKNEFLVEVDYPKLLITPKLKEKYIFNDKNVGFNLFCKGLEDENLYTHTIEIKNGNEPTSATVKKMEGIKGSEVSLDSLLAELDNNNKYFRIIGYYNGKEIPLSANKVAEFWTKMEIDFDNYKVESTWKQGTKENAPELDLTDEKNLTFDFYYELEGGQKIRIFNPVPSMESEPIIKINLEATQYKSNAKKDRFSIELYKSTFETFRKDQIIEIIFDFVDKDTKKSINKSLYCKKK